MTINTLYSLNCTACATSFGEHGTGAWTFKSLGEVAEIAATQGWSISKEVPNVGRLDFCPRCLIKRTLNPT